MAPLSRNHAALRARIPHWAVLAIIVITSVSLRALIALRYWLSGFQSDEAIDGLMVRHIAQGRPWPIFSYGQNYLGSLEPTLAALFYRLLGEGVPSLRVGTLLSFGLFLLAFAALLRMWWGWKVAALGTLLIGFISSPVLTEATYKAFGGYPAYWLLGILTLMVGNAALRYSRWWLWFGLGMIVGLGLWVNPLSAYYVLAFGVQWWLHVQRVPPASATGSRSPSFAESCKVLAGPVLVLAAVTAFFTKGCTSAWVPIAAAAARVFLGLVCMAAIIWLFRHRETLAPLLWAAFGFCLGNAPQLVALTTGSVPTSVLMPSCPTDVADRIPLILFEIVPIVLGAWPISQWPSFPLGCQIVFALEGCMALGALIDFAWHYRNRICDALLWKADHPAVSVLLLFVGPFALGPLLGARNLVDWLTCRYFVVAWQAFWVILAEVVVRRSRTLKVWALWVAVPSLLVVALSNGMWIRTAIKQHDMGGQFPPSAVRDLETYLDQRDCHGGLADYWVAYPLTYLTQERLIFAPFEGSDRYPPYTEWVEAQPKRAYVFRVQDTSRHEVKAQLQQEGWNIERGEVGPFIVFVAQRPSP